MHTESEKFKILSTCKEGYIGVCTCCREFSLAYNNLLITFPEEGMINFYHWLQGGAKSSKNKVAMQHNRNSLFKGPAANFYMAFNDREIEEILNMIREAMLIVEAKKIIMFD